MQNMWEGAGIAAYRSVVLYAVSLVAVRVMGKRSVAEMAPFDLIVLIIIGSVAALPLEDEEIALINGIVPIVVLTLLQFLISKINMRFRAVEKVTQGLSTPIVVNGQVMHENLKKERITEADFHILLRQAGADTIEDVALCILEPTGEVTLIKKKEAQPITPKDLEVLTLTRVDGIRDMMQQRLKKKYREVMREVPKKNILKS